FRWESFSVVFGTKLTLQHFVLGIDHQIPNGPHQIRWIQEWMTRCDPRESHTLPSCHGGFRTNGHTSTFRYHLKSFLTSNVLCRTPFSSSSTKSPFHTF